MDFKRTISCPAEGAAQERLGAAPPPAEFYDNFDEFEFDSDDKQCVSGGFTVVENDVKTTCSAPTKPSAAAATRAYNNRKGSARSPISVHEMLEQIAEEEQNRFIQKYDLLLREDYPHDIKRKPSDLTEVISNSKIIGSSKNTGGVTRNPNLVVTGSPDKRSNINRGQQQRVQQQKGQQQRVQQQKVQQLPKQSPLLFRRLFSCGGPGVGEIKESIDEFKANVKQKGVDTVTEVKGSFGDLGLTVRQVFSPVQNTKTGAGMVKKNVIKKVKKKLEKIDVDDEYSDDDGDNFTDDDDNVTDDDNGTTTDDDDNGTTDDDNDNGTTDDDGEGSESGRSFSDSESEYNTDDAYTDDASSEGSDCKQVTGW
jgi:hypothetical protein